MTEQQLSQYEAVNAPAEPADPWRNEVQDRLAHYKRRRGRRIEGAFTMRFPFPADDVAMVEPSPEATAVAAAVAEALAPEIQQPDPESLLIDAQHQADANEEITSPVFEESQPQAELVLEASPAEEVDPGPFVDPHPRPRPKRKVIAFPRQHSVTTEALYRLADPVTAEAPRILDVPEELESTPFLDGLQLDLPHQAMLEQRQEHQEHVELPCHPVSTSLRMLAGVIDLAVTGLGATVFAAVAFKILQDPPPAKLLVLGLVVSTGCVVERLPVPVCRVCGEDPGHDGNAHSPADLQRQVAHHASTQGSRIELLSFRALAGNGPDVGLCRYRRPLLARSAEPHLHESRRLTTHPTFSGLTRHGRGA